MQAARDALQAQIDALEKSSDGEQARKRIKEIDTEISKLREERKALLDSNSQEIRQLQKALAQLGGGLTDQQKDQARKLLSDGKSIADIAGQLGVDGRKLRPIKREVDEQAAATAS
jgi:predicted nuclease with TOPRIM domain